MKAKDDHGNTALQYARENRSVLEMIMDAAGKAGADPLATNKQGNHFTQLLRAKREDLSVDRFGFQAFFRGYHEADHGDAESKCKLTSITAGVTKDSIDEISPFYVALHAGKLDIAKCMKDSCDTTRRKTH